MGYRPNGCVHALSTKNGATLLAILTGSTEPATERGNAPPPEIFALHDLPWVETGPDVRQKRIWEERPASGGRSWRASSREPRFPHIATWVTS